MSNKKLKKLKKTLKKDTKKHFRNFKVVAAFDTNINDSLIKISICTLKVEFHTFHIEPLKEGKFYLAYYAPSIYEYPEIDIVINSKKKLRKKYKDIVSRYMA